MIASWLYARGVSRFIHSSLGISSGLKDGVKSSLCFGCVAYRRPLVVDDASDEEVEDDSLMKVAGFGNDILDDGKLYPITIPKRLNWMRKTTNFIVMLYLHKC